MLIAQISDTHILARTSDHPAANRRADDLRRCIADINRQKPDAVIFTGDTVHYGQPAEYTVLCSLLEPLRAPLYLVPGNRDEKAALSNAFSELPYFAEIGEFLHYVVEDHAVRLIAIDSTSPGERKGVFCAARHDWLDAVLSDQPNRLTLLFIHHPPFDVDDHYVGGYRRPEEAAALANVVSRHPQVDGLLCGHVHQPVKRHWAGTQASVMPSVAVDLRKGIEKSAGRERPMYFLHRVTTDGGLVSRATMVGDGP